MEPIRNFNAEEMLAAARQRGVDAQEQEKRLQASFDLVSDRIASVEKNVVNNTSSIATAHDELSELTGVVNEKIDEFERQRYVTEKSNNLYEKVKETQGLIMSKLEHNRQLMQKISNILPELRYKASPVLHIPDKTHRFFEVLIREKWGVTHKHIMERTGLSAKEISRIYKRLSEMKLVEHNNKFYKLTKSGREYYFDCIDVEQEKSDK